MDDLRADSRHDEARFRLHRMIGGLVVAVAVSVVLCASTVVQGYHSLWHGRDAPIEPEK